MRRKVLSGALALCMLFSFVGPGAWPVQAMDGQTTAETWHTHDDSWKVFNIKPGINNLGGGTYYLEKDISLEKATSIQIKGNVTLCLNGHKLDAAGKSLAISVTTGKTFTICDCSEVPREGHIDGDGLWHEGPCEGCAGVPYPLRGGVITGVVSGGILVNSSGHFKLESGNIAGNATGHILSTVVNTNSTVSVSGGHIVGNKARALRIERNGNGIVSGGTIVHNHDSVNAGAGICVNDGGVLTLSDHPVIADNVGANGHNNIYLNNGKLKLSGALTSTARIGVSVADVNKDNGVFTEGWQAYMGEAAPKEYFYSESAGYMVERVGDEAAMIAHAHDGLSFTQAWDGTAPNEGAVYTLDDDVTVAQGVTLPTMQLCLNGHRLETDGNAPLVINNEAQLSIYDCPAHQAGHIVSTIVLNTKQDDTASQAALQAKDYSGEPLTIQLAQPETAVGGCAVVAPEGKAVLDQTGYHFEYNAQNSGHFVARDTYAIHYCDQGGAAWSGILSEDAPTEHVYGVETILLEPQRAGYRFAGWHLASDCSDAAITTLLGDAITAPITLYAKWIVDVKAPIITEEPQDVTLSEGEVGTLRIVAEAAEGDVLSHQWYQSDGLAPASGSTKLEGETAATLALAETLPVGTHYYYCVVTAARDGVAVETVSKVATVTVEKHSAPSRPPVVNPGETMPHPDGSVTTTVSKPDGTTVATTVYPDGGKAVITTAPNGVTTASVKGDGPRRILLPMKEAGAGVVPMVTDVEGQERLEIHSVPTAEGIVMFVNDGDTIRLDSKTIYFEDVQRNHWAHENVLFASARGLLVGVDGRHFAPDAATSRAMIWSLLARLDGAVLPASDPWYGSSRLWVMENGVSDGTAPNDAITREQLAAMLYRFEQLPKTDGALNGYADEETVSPWARDAMRWAVQEGLIGGVTSDTLAPQGTASRAETAAVLTRYIVWQLGLS